MVYCAQMRAAFSTAARRDAVLADIETAIAGRPRFQASATRIAAEDLTSTIPGGVNGLAVDDLRFTARQDADALLSRVRTFATGVRTPLAGSWVQVHDCAHDQVSPDPCVVVGADRTVW